MSIRIIGVDAPNGVMLCNCDLCSRKDHEPAEWFVISESEAQKLVIAVENGHSHEVICLLKRQPWWDSMTAGVRARRHLRPDSYSW